MIACLIYVAFTWGVTFIFVEYFNGRRWSGCYLVMGMKAWSGDRFDFFGACIGAGSGSRIHKIRLIIMW